MLSVRSSLRVEPLQQGSSRPLYHLDLRRDQILPPSPCGRTCPGPSPPPTRSPRSASRPTGQARPHPRGSPAPSRYASSRSQMLPLRREPRIQIILSGSTPPALTPSPDILDLNRPNSR